MSHRFNFPKFCLNCTRILLTVSLFSMPVLVKAQITGTRTIGSGGDFATFTEAADALNSQGIGGSVIFNVLNGSYTEQFELGVISGTSASDTIIFQSQSGDPADVTLSFAASSIDDNYIMGLNGTAHVTIQNMTFRATGANYTKVITIAGTASQILIRNNIFHGLSSTSAYERRAIIFSDDPDIESITIVDNIFYDFAFGVFLYGGNSNYITGTRIINNALYTEGYAGIRLGFNYAPQIHNNTITARAYGINVNSDHGGGIYTSNHITTDGWGMDITRLGTDINRALIANNFVSVGEGGNQGITISNSVHTDVFYNSVFITSTSLTSAAFYSAGASIDGTVNIRNNNFSHQNSGYAIYTGDPDVINDIDYNNLYTAGNFISNWHGQRIMNLRELQQTSGKNSNSLSVYPSYDAFDNLHTSAPWLDGRGPPCLR